MALSNPRLEDVCRTFGLGAPSTGWMRVSGGLSNQLWRLETELGTFAVKRMIAGTDRSDFEDNVEASHLIERGAVIGGVSAPRPVPSVRQDVCLATIPCEDGSECWVRVHEWVSGVAPHHPTITPDLARQVGRQLSSIHGLAGLALQDDRTLSVVGEERWIAFGDRAATGRARWSTRYHALFPTLSSLEARVHRPAAASLVPGHRDLDDQNTLVTPEGRLVVLDWDAAGPVGAALDLTSVLMDWSNARKGEPRHDIVSAIVYGYDATRATLTSLDPSGWISAQLSRLAYGLERALGDFGQDAVRPGVAELQFFFGQLARIDESMDRWLEQWARL